MLTIFSQYQPQRNFWSRLLSPSWTDKGKDKDTQHIMSQLLQSVGRVSESSNRLRTNVQELKRFSHNYLSALPEAQKYLLTIPADNWGQLSDFINQIPRVVKYIQDTVPQTPEGAQLFNDSQNALSGFQSSVGRDMRLINENFQNVQASTQELRSQKPITGREFGEAGIASPMNEFSQLENALNKLYDNPLNRETLNYVQKAYSRLDDRLRSVPVAGDLDFNSWSQKFDNGQNEFLPGFTPPDQAQQANSNTPPPSTPSPSPSPSPSPNNQPDPPQPSQPEQNSGVSQVEQAANILTQLFDMHQLNAIVEALQSASLSSNPGDYGNLNALISMLDTRTPNNQGQPEQQGLAEQQPSVQQPSPSTETDDPEFVNSDWNDLDDDEIRNAREMFHSEMNGGGANPSQNPTNIASVKYLLTKVADIVSVETPDITNRLQAYLETDDLEEKVIFPEISNIIKV